MGVTNEILRYVGGTAGPLGDGWVPVLNGDDYIHTTTVADQSIASRFSAPAISSQFIDVADLGYIRFPFPIQPDSVLTWEDYGFVDVFDNASTGHRGIRLYGPTAKEDASRTDWGLATLTLMSHEPNGFTMARLVAGAVAEPGYGENTTGFEARMTGPKTAPTEHRIRMSAGMTLFELIQGYPTANSKSAVIRLGDGPSREIATEYPVVNLSYATNWGDYDTSWVPGSVRRVGKLVVMVGLMRRYNSTSTSGTVAATITDEDFWPPSRVMFTAITNTGAAVRVDIGANGTITPQAGLGVNGYLNLTASWYVA